jgi:hypothetical protein
MTRTTSWIVEASHPLFSRAYGRPAGHAALDRSLVLLCWGHNAVLCPIMVILTYYLAAIRVVRQLHATPDSGT